MKPCSHDHHGKAARFLHRAASMVEACDIAPASDLPAKGHFITERRDLIATHRRLGAFFAARGAAFWPIAAWDAGRSVSGTGQSRRQNSRPSVATCPGGGRGTPAHAISGTGRVVPLTGGRVGGPSLVVGGTRPQGRRVEPIIGQPRAAVPQALTGCQQLRRSKSSAHNEPGSNCSGRSGKTCED